MLKQLNKRWLAILSIFIVVPVGLLSKQYPGYIPGWISDLLGDILYEIFWCLFIFLLIPSRQAIDRIPMWVFAITCGIEFLQMWHPSPPFEWRSYLFGRLLLGTTFDWWDFPKYAIGSIIGWFWLMQIANDDTEAKIPR